MHAWLLLLVVVSGAPRRVTDDSGCNKGIDANNELDGEIVCKNSDGQKHYEGMYAHGKRVGLAKTWRDNGKLASVEHWADGKKSGLCEEYNREGVIEEACEFKDDKKDGPCKLYGREGKLREERHYLKGEQRGTWTEFWPNGKVKEKGTLDDNGRRQGLLERFREDGSAEEATTYAHGEKDGVEKEWHANGKPQHEVAWKNGKQHGLSKNFHETGQVADVTCYQNGNSVVGTGPCTGKTGAEVVTRYFPDGKPYETTTVRDGKNDGERQQFGRDGKLKLSEQYVAGNLEGLQKQFEGDRVKRQVMWKANKKHGTETVFFDDGKVSEETGWKDDRRQSHSTWWMNGKKKLTETADGDFWKRSSWYDNGQQQSEETVREGRYRGDNDGVERQWSEKGTLVHERNWKAGKRHGTDKAWFDKTGKPFSEEEWADDVRLSRKEWDESGAVVKDERYNPDGSRK